MAPISQARIIRPDNRFADGPLKAIQHLAREIWIFRSHIWTVFREQFHSSYYGARLGMLWNYILPVIPLSVYLLLSRLRVFPNFDGVDSAVFLTFGVTLWFLFSGCIQTPIQVIQSRNNEVMKTAFPLSAAIVAGFARLLFDTLIRAAFVVGVIILTGTLPAVESLLLPLILAPALALFIGIGLILGVLNIIYTDVSRVVGIALQYGLFVSGVIFPMPHHGWLGAINAFNPLATFIDTGRNIVLFGVLGDTVLYTAVSLIAVAIFVFSCRVFFIMEYRVRGIS